MSADVVRCEPEVLTERAKGHLYPVFLIQLAISHIITACSSFWGVNQSFELWAQFLAIGTPSLSSIRQWVLRVGLYVLQQPPQRRGDWIWVVDLTLQLGAAKCLVVLGISQADWCQRVAQGQGCLQHQDMTVLEIEVLFECNGQHIEQRLSQLSERVGQPVQVVSDHGSDLKKGIELYCQHQPGVIHTHDVTHGMALLLKHRLEKDEPFQTFLSQCHQSRQQLQQTRLAFLSPPAQRSQARYLNLEPLVEWAQVVLRYYQQGDFSKITPSHQLDKEAFCVLIEHQLKTPILKQLAALEPKTYDNQEQLSQQLMRVLSPEHIEHYGPMICQAADLGRRQFQEKLGWLLDRQPELQEYDALVSLVQRANKQLKQQGLNHQSHLQFAQDTQQMNLSQPGQAFRAAVIDYIKQQGSPMDETQTLLATSDVLESLFGKYKLFCQRSPLKEVGRLILTIPLCTVHLTGSFVKRALESVRGVDVDNWAKEVLGTSMFAQRKAVFEQKGEDTEVA